MENVQILLVSADCTQTLFLFIYLGDTTTFWLCQLTKAEIKVLLNFVVQTYDC
jgi:hypothetical protein